MYEPGDILENIYNTVNKYDQLINFFLLRKIANNFDNTDNSKNMRGILYINKITKDFICIYN